MSKGLNRGLGTIAAALLGFIVDSVANFLGPAIEPYVVGCSIFIVGKTAQRLICISHLLGFFVSALLAMEP